MRWFAAFAIATTLALASQTEAQAQAPYAGYGANPYYSGQNAYGYPGYGYHQSGVYNNYGMRNSPYPHYFNRRRPSVRFLDFMTRLEDRKNMILMSTLNL